MNRHLRPHRPWLSTLLACTLLLLTLPGCGGASSSSVSGSAGSALDGLHAAPATALKGLPRVSGQNGETALFAGRATLVGPVLRARVTAYAYDGTLLGTTETDDDGAFEMFIALEGWTQRDPAMGVGLASSELRVAVEVPANASQVGGTTLLADLPWGFAHVSHVSTETSLLRQRLATLTLAAAEAAVKAYHRIPA